MRVASSTLATSLIKLSTSPSLALSFSNLLGLLPVILIANLPLFANSCKFLISSSPFTPVGL